MGVRRDGRAAAGPARSPSANPADGLPHATLKELRKSTRQTQEDLAAALGVELVATFPGQPPVIIDQIGERKRKAAKRRRRAARATGDPGQLHGIG